MDHKTFIKLGSKTLNIASMVSIDFSEDDKTVFIVFEKSEHKFKFTDEKEFERLKTYMRMISNQFESAEEIPSGEGKKTILEG